MTLTVLDPGPLTLLQDAGRPGQAALGVSPSGALDIEAYARGNLMVGNPAGAAALEVLFGPAEFRAEVPAVVVVTGAGGAVEVNGRHVHGVLQLAAGDVLRLGRAEAGLRYYVCVRGGLEGERELGSLSTDTLSGLGPVPLRRGDLLRFGSAQGAAGFPPSRRASNGPHAVRILEGPRRDWFTAESWQRLIAGTWSVTAESNRVGLRLDGVPMERSRTGELPTEGMVAGAIQVPPSGLPVVFLADHPVTGGYPVIGVVHSADLSILAQAAPGQRVRFLGGGR
ncbi:biotin-dependent carboxylase-like uncharacterized protein [Arthrobacter pigmenti]|uniref:Biotin-dependent carboxylase-like uncharacterized protein n=1 Tax=Arthrobacter pigmenti TaxID=271432 RepID=A0A846RV12_9MICC|nr:biotin-dependent carboxyltransferase family protein [Arthrobacter pigmenti]NJC24414.1 biotin-dependent carboxylase-like uncharacterized protein [Arthrobacter pigmenti]